MNSISSTYRRQERAEATRARLIQAAEKIFARDGFEAAKLEEIAAAAGYTRGAFYANFNSKEDLFLALLEREVSHRIDSVEKLIHKFRDPQAKLRAFRQFFLTLCQDRRWSLLALEFKLFAVRHPEVKARLAAMNRRLVGSRIGILQSIMEASGRPLPAAGKSVVLSLSAVTHALALEHMLDRSLMPEEDLKKILASYVDSLTGLTSGRSARRSNRVRAVKKVLPSSISAARALRSVSKAS
jgi:AcrR family transcriptional regulator